MSVDNINHPSHYEKHNVSIEFQPIDIAKQMGFTQGNAFKYAIRYKEKNGIEDLKKCLYYLNTADSWIDVFKNPINTKILKTMLTTIEDADAKEALVYICSGMPSFAKEAINKVINRLSKPNPTYEEECIKVLENETNLKKATIEMLNIGRKYVKASDRNSYNIFLDKIIHELNSKKPNLNYEIITACRNVFSIMNEMLEHQSLEDLLEAYTVNIKETSFMDFLLKLFEEK